jgi:hypothetical protein
VRPHASLREFVERVIRTFGAAVLAVTLATAGQASAETATSLCDFVEKVLAAKVNGFEALKGEAQNPAVFKNEVFHGALLPLDGANCTLFLNSQAGRVTLPPRYSCTLAMFPDFTAANNIFARTAQELRACRPKANFTVMYDGDGTKPDETFDWIVGAEEPGVEYQLEMSNGLSAIADALGMGTPGAPGIAIDLDITDTLSEGDSI